MRILYFANHSNRGSDNTEKHITLALQSLGHEVKCIHENDPHSVPVRGFDFFLFHKGGPYLDLLLSRVKYPKIFWYFDKVKFWNGREKWFERVLPRIDLGFLTDGDYQKAVQSEKLIILRQGIGDSDTSLGKPNSRYKGQICFTGSVYNGRESFVKRLKDEFGKDFFVCNEAFNRDLYDLCASVPIIIAPRFPSTDNYWSSRIYMILGSGGFLIHPQLSGLKDDGLIAGKHFVAYETDDQMVNLIRKYLSDPIERERIRLQGYEYVTRELTYRRRCQNLLKVIQQRSNIGTIV